MSVDIIRGNALDLPLADDSVDLVVTSPPYFGLRSYQDGGEHYDGQIGAEATPAEFVDALIAAGCEDVVVDAPDTEHDASSALSALRAKAPDKVWRSVLIVPPPSSRGDGSVRLSFSS